MKKVEILAPAGSMECFMAAINAGADAVYMAGKSFGARASADNFTEEEFIKALNIAHIYGRKIYLTLNTLIKEKEWDNIYFFLKPLYEAGLDGVIIQDLGLIDYLSQQFPDLPLHASTQMTITDYSSASILKDKGICRVVPARELSLEEIIKLKKETGLEIETFIHGALCYCYSGQCLFSSYLGGRSGNRGRCAGPCRLPYEVNSAKKNIITHRKYPLSLKDLCTIEHIGELIEAGIDSFKIEGRMKSPEYVAGVTYLYRKYVDAYYEGRSTKVLSEDIKLLENLYLRSSIGSGYYYKHNGADMISIDDPSYNNQSQNAVNKVRDSIMCNTPFKCLSGSVYIRVNEPISFTIWDSDGNSISVLGETACAANSKAATEADIIKQLNKTGGSGFVFDGISVDLGEDCFVPVKFLNEIRRNALDEFEKELLKNHKRITPDIINEKMMTLSDEDYPDRTEIGVSILDENILKTVLSYDVDRVYIPYDLFYIGRLEEKAIYDYKKRHAETMFVLSLPRIIRKRDEKYLKSLKGFLDKFLKKDNNQGLFEGILVKNMEEIYYLTEFGYGPYIELDYTLYGWNRHSIKFLSDYSRRLTASLELSFKELCELAHKNITIVMYGYVPLMVSANCLAKTYNNCMGDRYGFEYLLKDRYNKREQVFVNCCHCYNEIYNAVPTSIHKKFDEIKRAGFRRFRLDFTIENREECRRVLDYYFKGCKDLCPADEYTTGHFDKGAI